ncbi:integrase family protein (plasmid) [Calothrix parasitica NIES-267]|uniref:Integrase family protein n=1 Tax=Calothrix parasitica NIES-267 TaxID=1973488 RepID=A0A1Z4M344_9CYAN|nr:integrase family protein [Calothrix parasitica NIES-267]
MSSEKPHNAGDNHSSNFESLSLTQPLPLTLNPAEVYIRSLGKGSRRTMREALNAIAKLLTNNECDAATLDWSKLKYRHTAIIRSILMEKYSPAMANKMICALRRTLQETWRLELMTREQYSRAADIALVRGKSPLKGRSLNASEVFKLWENSLNDNSNLGARDAALLGILSVGLRRSEVTNLNLNNFKSRTRSLNFLSSKSNSERILYLPKQAVEVIKQWLVIRGKEPGSLLYPLNKGHKIIHRKMSDQGILRALQRRGERAGVHGFTPHDFRRTFISDLLDLGVDIVTVQKMVDHASPKTTANYDRRGEKAKKQAIDLLNLPNISLNKTPTKQNKKPKAKNSTLKCPNCKSKELLKEGFQVLADGNKHQRFRCQKCDYAFTPLLSVPDKKG